MPAMLQLQSRAPTRAPVSTGSTAAYDAEDDYDLEEGTRAGALGALGALDSLRQLVADPEGSPDAVLSALFALQRDQPGQVPTLLADTALLEGALGMLGADRAALALLGLQFGSTETPGRTLRDGGELLLRTTGLTGDAWMRLVAGRGAEACAGVLESAALVEALQGLARDPLELLPGLAFEPARLAATLQSHPELGAWISTVGGEEALGEVEDTVAAAEAAAEERDELRASGDWDRTLARLPDGPATDPAVQDKLYYYLLATAESDSADWEALFEKRFGFSLESVRGVSWDRTSVVRLWQLAALAPSAHIEDIVKVIREGDRGEATGWAGDGEIGMEWGTDTLGVTEIGLYTDDLDPMRGLNLFDATVRHEIGHIVGAENGYDQPGGFAYTQFGWDSHDDFASLVEDVFLPAKPLELTGIAAGSRDRARQLIVSALGQVTNYSEAGYRSAVERVQRGLWSVVRGEPLIQYLLGRTVGGAWDNPDPIDGRSYHVAYNWFGFCSAPESLYATKPSTYAMRSPMEWFAEAYATFYAEADQPGQELGGLLASRDSALAAVFRDTVHGGGDALTERAEEGGSAESAIKASGSKRT